MKFGAVALNEALGARVAHAVRTEGLVLKKGDIVTAAHVDTLRQEGINEIIVARLDEGDVAEDAAALELAKAFCGAQVRLEKPFTGRVNFFAGAAGVLRVDVAGVARANDVDEAITLATLPDFRAVQLGEMVATVKIIPFAVQQRLLDTAKHAGKLIQVVPFKSLKVGVISTLLPGLKPSVVRKTLAVMERRLAQCGAKAQREVRVLHDVDDLTFALEDMAADHDLIVIFGASAITDRRDVIPAALEAAGGQIVHFGMPVDPGNLLLLGRLDKVWVLGAPGCARSPKENGFDWILQRLLAGVTVSAADIRALGVGGLLMEIGSRPQPRLGGSDD